MKPLHYEITARSLIILVLVCVLGAPVVGMAGAVFSRIFLQFLGPVLPAPISLLLAWSTLLVLSALLFGRVVWIYRIQHPWLVGGAGVLYGLGVYLSFLISSSRFLPSTQAGFMLPGWPGNLLLLGPLSAMLLIPNVVQSREPVCAQCRQWYGTARQVGNIPFPQREGFLTLIDRGQMYEAGQWIVEEEQAAPPNLEIYRQSCPACQMSDPLVTVKETFLDGRGMVKRRVSRRGFVTYLESRDLDHRLQEGSADDL